MSRNAVGLRAIIFALIGFGFQSAIVLGIGFGSKWQDFLDPVITSLIGLLLGAFILGRLFGGSLLATETTRSKAVIMGALIGWLSLWIQTLSGSSVEFFSNLHRDSNAFVNYIFKPTFWLIFLGSVPAIIIGAFFGNSVWKANHKSLP